MNNKKFASLLKKYINESQISVVAISKLTDIPRSTIQKYMSGIQTPGNYATIEKIIDLLSLSTNQKSQLRKAYLLEKIGYLNYQKMEAIKQTIQIFNSVSDNISSYNLTFDFHKINNLAHNPEEVKLLTHFIMGNCINNPSKRIFLLLNANNCLFDIVYSYAKNNSALKIRQIINLKNLYNDISLSNLNQLQKLLPLSLLENDITIKYIYGKENNDSYYSAFPYMIISDEYVLLINSTYSLGILLGESQNYFLEEFKKKEHFSKKLIYKTFIKENIFNDYNDFVSNENEKKNQVFSYIPFLYLWLEPKSIKNMDNFFNINKKDVIHLFQNQSMQAKKIIHYFSLNAIKEKLNNPLITASEKEIIYSSIKNMINDISLNNNNHINVINDEKFEFPNNLIILSNPTSLSFIYKNIKISIFETTICQDFLLLDSLFQINEYCYNKDQSIQKLNNIL